MEENSNFVSIIGSRRSCSYLLRVWQEEPGVSWRAMLQSVTTQEKYFFNNLEDLKTFLMMREMSQKMEENR